MRNFFIVKIFFKPESKITRKKTQKRQKKKLKLSQILPESKNPPKTQKDVFCVPPPGVFPFPSSRPCGWDHMHELLFGNLDNFKKRTEKEENHRVGEGCTIERILCNLAIFVWSILPLQPTGFGAWGATSQLSSEMRRSLSARSTSTRPDRPLRSASTVTPPSTMGVLATTLTL